MRGTKIRIRLKAYDYRSPTGELLFQCVRFAPKKFRQRRPNPVLQGEWIWDLAGIKEMVREHQEHSAQAKAQEEHEPEQP